MKIKALLIFFYTIASLLFAFNNINFQKEFSSLTFILKDNKTLENLEIAIKSDYNTQTIFLTRLFHNKPFSYLETFFTQLSRSLDLTYIFSFSGQARYFHIIEFPFFAFSIIYLLRKMNKHYYKYILIIPLLFFSLITSGIFLPDINLIKIIPLVITFKIVTIIGILELINNNSAFLKR